MRRRASEFAAPAAAAEADARPGEETAREDIHRRKRSANRTKVSDQPKDVFIYVQGLKL